MRVAGKDRSAIARVTRLRYTIASRRMAVLDGVKMRRGKLAADERGIGTTEYLILIVLIAIAGFAAWSAFGDAVSSKIGGHSSVHIVDWA